VPNSHANDITGSSKEKRVIEQYRTTNFVFNVIYNH